MSPASSPYRRTYRLPFGVRVAFTWEETLSRVFEPKAPADLSSRQRRKLMVAYVAARADFLADLAIMLGGPVVVVDEVGVYVSRPGTRQ